jgi:plasmid stabilization system protein ParE
MRAKGPKIAQAALTDLEEIWLYIASDSPSAADKMIEELYEHMHRLAAVPGIGHLREDLALEPLRFWPVRHYLIIYRLEKPIEVVRVLSGYRDIHALLTV